MDSRLKALYKETLLKHSKEPRNNHELPDSKRATLRNPLCGDEVTIYVSSEQDGIAKISFTAQACSICTASASMLSEHLHRNTPSEAKEIAQSLIDKLREPKPELLGSDELEALAGVSQFPSRIRCATLPWEAFLQAVEPESPEQ